VIWCLRMSCQKARRFFFAAFAALVILPSARGEELFYQSRFGIRNGNGFEGLERL